MKFVVLLDNGHGSNTAGKRSPKLSDGRQLLEYKWCRNTVAALARKLDKLGVEYKIVTPETTDISLSTRVSRVNKYAAEAKKNGKTAVFISVHVNALGMGDKWMNAQGWSTWTTKGVTKADPFAQCICDEAKPYLEARGLKMREDKSDGDSDYEANYYVLANTNCPATLSENFFMDNEKDCKFLLTPESNEICAEIHARGIVKYIKSLGLWEEQTTAQTSVFSSIHNIVNFVKCGLV